MKKLKFQQLKLNTQPQSSDTQLYALKTEVDRSRIAVEHMPVYGGFEEKGKIGNLQDQLQQEISNLNLQMKKKKVLTELVWSLKGDMLKYESTLRKQEEQDEIKKQKQISKLELEMDKILQRHNQEIAKIKKLKDLVSNKRSQRVVYSNLFKKIEKQIKTYEEIYKEQVVIGQIHQAKTTTIKQLNYKNTTNSNFIDANRAIQDNVSKNYQIRDSNDQSTWNGFITKVHQDEQKLKFSNPFVTNQTHRKQHINSDDRSQIRNTGYKEEKFAHTKDLLKQISMYTDLLEKIRINTECSNTQQIFDDFNNLKQNNEYLMFKIEEQDAKMEQIFNKNKKLNKLTDQEHIRKLTMSPHLFTSEKSANNEALEQKTEKDLDEMKQTLNEIGCLFDLKFEDNMGKQESALKILDSKISSLCGQIKSLAPITSLKQDAMFSESIVDCIFERMQRYNNCERIFDQKLFRQQYYKQLNKKRPMKVRNEGSKTGFI